MECGIVPADQAGSGRLIGQIRKGVHTGQDVVTVRNGRPIRFCTMAGKSSGRTRAATLPDDWCAAKWLMATQRLTD